MKSKSKSFILGMAMVQALSVSSFVKAEGIILGTSPIIPAGNTNIISTSGSGTHDINQTVENASDVYRQIISTNQAIQENDRIYLDQINSRTQDVYKQMTALVYGTLTNLSIGVSAGSVDSKELMKARAQYKRLRVDFESALAAFNAVTQGALPSQTSVTVKGNPTQTNVLRNIDLTKLVGVYGKALNDLDSEVNELQFSVVMNGNPEIIKGNLLSYKFKSPLMSQDEIKKLRAEAEKMMAPGRELKEKLLAFNRILIKSISTFIDRYGTSEDWRFMSESDKIERDNQLKLITQGFWARSYLRAKFGVKIGTFNPVTFEKSKFNIADWFKSREKLTAMRLEQAYTNDELIAAMSNIQEVVNIFSARAVDFKNSNEPILARAYAFAHWATGGSTASETMLMIETLMAADIKEEQIITNQSREDLVKLYQQRYQADSKTKSDYQGLKCDWDRSAKGCEGISVSTSLVSDSTDKSTIRGHFNSLMKMDMANYMGDVAQGREKLKQAELAQMELVGGLLDGVQNNTEDL